MTHKKQSNLGLERVDINWELKLLRGMSLYPLPSNFEVSSYEFSCYVMDNSCLAGRSFLFLDEKKRTKEKSKQNNAPARDLNAPLAVLLGPHA